MQQPELQEDNNAANNNTVHSTQAPTQYPLFNDSENAATNDAEQPVVEATQQYRSGISNDARHHDDEQPTEESLQQSLCEDGNDAALEDTEQHVAGSTQQTPKAVGNDSGYNSPQDETSAWEKILEMREREHQNDLAAMQDVHDDEMKDLRKELSSEIGKKQLLQKRVKKEVLAKRDFKEQLEALQGEHRVVVEASASKDNELAQKEKDILALRARVQEMEIGFHNKEQFYLDTIHIQGDMLKADEEEVIDLHFRTHDMDKELISMKTSKQGALSGVGTNAPNLQHREGPASAQWKALYYHAFEEAQALRKQLAVCDKQREQAMGFTQNFQAQLELANSANAKLTADVASKQQKIDYDGPYHEQIRGQNFDLQKQVNESIREVAILKYQKAKAKQEAAEEVKDLTRKLDNRTEDLSALEVTRAEWQADPEGVLLNPPAEVETKAMMLALAKRFQLTINENANLKQRMEVREKEYDALNAQRRKVKAQRDALSQSLAERAEEITSLQENIFEFDTKVIRREMNEETAKQAEPLYIQAMADVAQKDSYIGQCLKEIRRLREAASENDEDVANSEARAHLDQARTAAVQNRRQHLAKVEKLKDLIEKLHQRMLQLEATLAAAGRAIVEPNNEGDMLKAQCARVLGYDGADSESENGSPFRTPSQPVPGNFAHETLESEGVDNLPGPGHNSEDMGDECVPPPNNWARDTSLDDSPTHQSERESHHGPRAETERSSESSTTINVRRFVMRALAEGGTRTRVYGEPSSPAAPPAPEISTPAVPSTGAINPSAKGDVQDAPLNDTDNGSEGDEDGDLQPFHPPPLPAASLAWMNKNKPFGHGEPVRDDQFGKEALKTRR